MLSTSARPQSDGAPSLDADRRLAQALQRIANLEDDLARHRDLLARSLETVSSIQATYGWQLVNRWCNWRERWLPRGTRRRALFTLVLHGVVRRLAAISARGRRSTFRSINYGYARWIRKNEPTAADLHHQRLARLPGAPHFSLVVLLSDPKPRLLRALLRSVRAQTYPQWQLILAGDIPSGLAHTLVRREKSDDRIRILPGLARLSVDARAAAALEAAEGDFVGFLGEEDTLAPFALFALAEALVRQPDVDLIYSDEDSITRYRHRRFNPHFKADWSPDTFRSHNYIGNLSVFRRTLIGAAGGVGPGFRTDCNYDLLLRATEQARRIVHLPQILYHRRQPARRCLPASDAKASLQALQDHLCRRGIPARVAAGLHPNTYRVTYLLPTRPLVSVIIPSRDRADLLRQCVDSILHASYANSEILIMENGSSQTATFDYYREVAAIPKIRLLTWSGPFNYSAINNLGAAHARGEVFLFLNNDTRALHADWLDPLLEHALRPEIGAVGAKLCHPDDTIQHAGVVFGADHRPIHYHARFPRQSPGYAARLATVRNLSAVTGACLMTRKAVFDEVRGFDETLAVEFNDVDYCFKLRARGYRIVWTPHAELYHFENSTRGRNDSASKIARSHYELHLLQSRWHTLFTEGDPYYSPHLAFDRLDCSLRLA